jgi:hypothetical protein
MARLGGSGGAESDESEADAAAGGDETAGPEGKSPSDVRALAAAFSLTGCAGWRMLGALRGRMPAPVVESGTLAGGSPQVVGGIEVPLPWWGACWRVHEAPAAQRPPNRLGTTGTPVFPRKPGLRRPGRPPEPRVSAGVPKEVRTDQRGATPQSPNVKGIATPPPARPHFQLLCTTFPAGSGQDSVEGTLLVQFPLRLGQTDTLVAVVRHPPPLARLQRQQLRQVAPERLLRAPDAGWDLRDF